MTTMEVPDLSQQDLEEMMKLLETYEAGGKAFGPLPEELQELVKNVKRVKGQPTGDAQTQEIIPEPGFVVKTSDQNGKKVFINICHSKQVPSPGGWNNGLMPENVLKALDDLQRDQPNADAEALRFPLSCSELQQDTDKAGQPCSTIDCIIHSDVLSAAQQHRPLKAFVVELALEWVSSKHKLQLDAKFKLPKMAYKGSEVRAQRVRVDPKPLVEDVTSQRLQQAEAPSFPLLLSKQEAAKAAAGYSKNSATAAEHKAVSSKQQANQLPTPVEADQQGSGAAAGDQHSNNSSRGSSWQHSIKCQGKPVTHMLVTLQLPHHASSSSGGSWVSSGIIAEVCGRHLRITATEALSEAPCVVQLPFAANSLGAEAQMHSSSGQLQVRLPYLPLQQWVQQLAQQSPHVFSKMPVAHATYMELDEDL